MDPVRFRKFVESPLKKEREITTFFFFFSSQEAQYAKWMAACRLAAKGKTMADASYDAEVKSILAFLAMQKPAPAPAINPSSLDIQPDDYVAPRFIRKLKNKVKQTCQL